MGESSFKLFSITLLAIALSTILLGLELENRDLSNLARFLSQTGTLNDKNLEKIHRLPFVLLLTGVEGFFLGLLGLTAHQNVLRRLPCFERMVLKQKIFLLLLCSFAIIAGVAMNFSAVSLASWIQNIQLNNEEIVALDFGREYILLEALQRSTPEKAHILIRTRSPVKYLLNYSLYPRRFYFYRDAEIEFSQAPNQWVQNRRITWTLDIADSDPVSFTLLPLNQMKD